MSLETFSSSAGQHMIPRRKELSYIRPRSLLYPTVGDLFSDFRKMMLSGFGETPAESEPRMDLVESDEKLQLMVELPGVSEADVTIEVVSDVLTIKGKIPEVVLGKSEQKIMSERQCGAFERSMQLPAGVDPDKVQANFDKGLLTLTIPKGAESKALCRKIPITH